MMRNGFFLKFEGLLSDKKYRSFFFGKSSLNITRKPQRYLKMWVKYNKCLFVTEYNISFKALADISNA